MTDEAKVNSTHTYVNPTKAVTKSPNFGTLHADYAKVTVMETAQTCTFTFFQTHPIPVLSDKGLILDRMEDEMVLEIKMPLTSAFGLAMYMASLLKEFQGNQPQARNYFGPTSITFTKKRDEEAKP